MPNQLPLPLTAALFQVLLALSDGDKHGYAILKEVEMQSGGEVRLSTGTLYGIVRRLLTDGMIAEVRGRPAPALDDPRRRYYRLTPWGRQVAAGEAERMSKVLATARLKRLVKSPMEA